MNDELEQTAKNRPEVAELLLQLVLDTPRCMALLTALDKVAKEENSFEYGLPLSDEAQASRLREVVYKWVCGNVGNC